MLDWLPAGHLVWFILDAVRQMCLQPIYRAYRNDGWGGKAYEPSMMVALLLYAYCEGVRSSRGIERLCERDIAYKVIAAGEIPDHTAIARFRQRHEAALQGIFKDVLVLCARAGLICVGLVALDGTKMGANAALSANRTAKHIEEEVRKMLAEAQAVDAKEDARYGEDKRGDELPEELIDPESRLARLKACKERLEREAAEARQKQADKIKLREVEEALTGRKKRGRKPKSPEEAVKQEAKANVTDPESRIMKTRSGYVQGYNGQAVVTQEQIIVAADLTQEENDVLQLHPMLEQAQANLVQAGITEAIESAAADAGYWSEENMREVDPEGPELYIATQKDRIQRQVPAEGAATEDPPSADLSPKERMERKLRTPLGRNIYRKRGQTVEPVFGQIKGVRQARRFMQRGFSACRSEWLLLCATHNLLKLWRSGNYHWRRFGTREIAAIRSAQVDLEIALGFRVAMAGA
jgi:transposase